MKRASYRALALACLLTLCGLAQQQLTVAKLVEFIRSSIQQKLADKDVAGYLTGVRLTERLDPAMVESLQGQGAGPKTVAALNHLAELSAKLTPPAPKAPAAPARTLPIPSYAEQQAVITAARDYALNYTQSLPDFICLQVTRRYADRHYRPGEEGSWAMQDRLAEKLSYFEQHEKYEPISQNDNSLYGKTADDLGGALSRGEFGTLLREIFDPASDAEFEWKRWGMLRGNLSHVFGYYIDRAHSKETISFNKSQTVTPAYHGEIYVDKATNTILRVTVEPEPPADFPVQNIHQTLDYASTEISGQKFWLPLSSEVIMRAEGVGTKNDIDFRSYRKYSADTSIKFDAADDDPPADEKKPGATQP